MINYKVAVLGFPNAMALDFVGPMDVFAYANELSLSHSPAQNAPYQSRLYSLDGGPFTAYNGMRVLAEGSYRDISADADTLLVLSGGYGVAEVMQDHNFIAWLRQHGPSFKRVLSICSATFILAQAGLISGKTVTTHWVACDLLRHAFPDVQVNENAIYIRNDRIYTSAGVSTGIDLALAVVMEDLGRELAMQVAQHLVLYLHRPGGQRQFSQVMALQRQQRGSFNDLAVWMSENLHKAIDVETLAQQACMSPRHFSRKFLQETGTSPMRFLSQIRLEKSRALLEQGELPIQAVASACGFQSAETFRRQFQERYGLSPMHYQGRF